MEAAGASDFDLAVHAYHNQVRQDPKSMIPKLEEMLTWFEGNDMHRPGNPVILRTNEGPAAINELIGFLNEQPPLPELEWQ